MSTIEMFPKSWDDYNNRPAAPTGYAPDLILPRNGNFMNTFLGGKYWPLDPRPEDVHIEDVAHHLSLLCRYTGAVMKFYSVAEHSYWMSFLVPREHQFAALMHDATEAYLGDVGRPLKRHLPNYKDIEESNWTVIAAKFGLPLVLPKIVHDMDGLICLAEQEQLCSWYTPEDATRQREHYDLAAQDTPKIVIAGYRPETAEDLFLQRFWDLQDRRP